jgi:hypothetical protein
VFAGRNVFAEDSEVIEAVTGADSTGGVRTGKFNVDDAQKICLLIRPSLSVKRLPTNAPMANIIK